MAYQLVHIDPLPRVDPAPVAKRERGRPRIYTGPTLPVSFRVPAHWRVTGSEKSRHHRFNLTKLFAIYYEQFLTRPIEYSQEIIRRYEEARGALGFETDDL